MEKIKNIWFDNNRIFMRTVEGKIFSRPLEAYPELKDASTEQRNDYSIADDGESIRWEAIDIDMHISSFYETTEPNADNDIARLFRRFSCLNPVAVAAAMNIHKSLLEKYIYGIAIPSPERISQLKDVLHSFGKDLQTA